MLQDAKSDAEYKEKLTAFRVELEQSKIQQVPMNAVAKTV